MNPSNSPSDTHSSSQNLTPNPKKAHNRLNWLLILPVIILSIVIWQLFSPKNAPVAQEEGFPPRPVKTAPITPERGVKPVKLLGQVEAGETATVRSQIEGRVKQVFVREGDKITEGMTLVLLEDIDQQVALNQAKARLAQEKSRLDQLLVGTRPEIISQRKAELSSAIAREQEARANLESILQLTPDLIAQREADVQRAIAREKETQDNLKRVENLAQEGAFSERALVEAKADADAANSDRLKAESALTAEKIQTRQTEAEGKTTLDSAIAQRRREEALLEEAIAGPTPEEIGAQRGLVAGAQASVQQVELQLSRVQIKALTSGIVQSRTVNVGDYVESSDAVLTIVSDKEVNIFLEVPESLVRQVSTGLPVQLTARALPQWQETANITAVVPTTDPTSRRQLVRLNLNNPPKNLLAGMAVQGKLMLPLQSDENTFIVPRDSLIRRGDNWFLFTIKDNVAQQIKVDMIADMGEKMAVASPELSLGQSLVVTGSEGLKDEAKVKVISGDS
ncbi:MAG: efflux RND transporter periplasmic adaptor subunit [Microcystaceae cyanobacterium]